MNALYLESDQTEHSAVITQIGQDEINKKPYQWVQLNETIFHPKGGGQPSDEGHIAGIKVAYVHKVFFDKNRLDQFEIYHCFEMDQPINFKIGEEVKLIVDSSTRLLHSRLHTAGHVLADATGKCFPELEAYQGNHYPNNSYVRFKILSPLQTEDKEVIKQKVASEFKTWIDQELQVGNQFEPSGLRAVKVYQNWSPCGGTHVKNLKEIGRMEVSDLSINKKEGVLTIKYALTNTNV